MITDPEAVLRATLEPVVGKYEQSLLEYWMTVVLLVYTACVFTAMLFFPAPYGRYTSSKFGCMIPARLAWSVQESPAVFVAVWLLATSPAVKNTSVWNLLLLFIFVFHYINRSFIFPWKIEGGKPTPLTTVVSAIVFCVFNGFLQAYSLTLPQNKIHLSLHFIIGLALCLLGMYINISCDNALCGLRKMGDTGYHIRRGGLFEYVTGANYFGEIVEWWGFALAAWSYPAAAFALFTTLFLGVRALHHHRFYKTKFEDYPRNRKIIIPFLL